MSQLGETARVRRVLNVRFLVVLAALTAIMAVGLFALNWYQVRQMRGHFLEQARQCAEKGEYERSADYAQRFLLLDPGHLDALLILNEAVYTLADSANALQHSVSIASRVLRADEDNQQVRRQRAESMLRLGQFTDSLADLAILLNASPDDPELWLLGARALAARNLPRSDDDASTRLRALVPERIWADLGDRRRDRVAAASCCLMALERLTKKVDKTGSDHDQPSVTDKLRSGYRDAATMLAELYRVDAELVSSSTLDDKVGPARADELMDDLVARFPDWAPALLTRYEYRLRFAYGSDEQARADLQRALELAPEDVSILIHAARDALGQKELSRAQQFVDRGLAQSPQETALRQLRWQITRRRDGPAAMLAMWEKGEQKTNDDPDLTASLIQALIDENRQDGAQPQIDLLEQKFGDPARAEFYRGLVARAERRWGDAIGSFHEVVARSGSERTGLRAQAFFFQGTCHEEQSQDDMALQTYTSALDAAPGYPAAAVARARVLHRMQRWEEAKEAYATAMRMPGGEAALLPAYIRVLMAQASREPADREGRWWRVEQLLEHAPKVIDDPVEIAFLKADHLLLRDQAEQALEVVRKARASLSEDRLAQKDVAWRLTQAQVTAHRRLARRVRSNPAPETPPSPKDGSEVNRHDTEASRLLNEYATQFGDSASLRRLRYGLLQDQQQEQEARHALANDLDRLPVADRLEILLWLGNLERAAGNGEAARRRFRQAADLDKHHFASRTLLLDLAIAAGDHAAVERLESEIAAIEGPDQSVSRLAKAWRLATAKPAASSGDDSESVNRVDQARAILGDIRKNRPSWSLPYALLGSLAEREGDTDTAIELYRQAIDRGYFQTQTVRRLLTLLARSNRVDEASEILDGLEMNAYVPQEIENLAATIWWASDNREKALSLARRAATAGQEGVGPHLWLAHMLERSGELEEAERWLLEALDIAPQEPGAWLLAIGHYARRDRLADAERLLERALAALLPERTPLFQAQCCAMLGPQSPKYREKALQLCLDAAENGTDDTALLLFAGTYLLRQQLDAPAGHALSQVLTIDPENRRARRLLAVSLARNGNWKDRETALALLDQNRNAQGEWQHPADRRTFAQILIIRGRLSDFKQARAALETLVESGDATSADRYNLAGACYQMDAREPSAELRQRAQALMLQVLSQEPGNANYLMSFSEQLLQLNLPSSAATWIAKLEQLEPGSLRAVRLRAGYEHLTGFSDRATQRLLNCAESVRSDDPEFEAAHGLIGRDLDQMDRPDEAEQIYRRWAGQLASGRLALARFLGRHARSDEAFQLLEALADVDNQRLVAVRTALQIADSTKLSAKRLDQISPWINNGITKQPQQADEYRTWAAHLAFLKADYESAVKILRPLAERKNASEAVLNNLGWYLGEHLQRPQDGLVYVERAIERFGPLATLLDSKAVLLHRLGSQQQLAEAERLERAIDRQPTAEFLFHLADLHRTKGDHTRAKAEYQRAIAAGGLDSISRDQRAAFSRLSEYLAGSAN